MTDASDERCQVRSGEDGELGGPTGKVTGGKEIQMGEGLPHGANRFLR